MNAKNVLVSGILGGLANFLLGWLFYGIMFPNLYPQDDNSNMLFIFLGCLTFGLFLAYVLTQLADTKTLKEGLSRGAAFGFFYGLAMNFFMYSSQEVHYQNMLTDVVVNVVMAALTGMVIALIHGKMTAKA